MYLITTAETIKKKKLGIIIEVLFFLSLNLQNSVHEVLMGDQSGLPTQSNHTRLNTDSLTLSPVKIICRTSQFIKVHIFTNGHFSGVDLHNSGPGLFGRGGKFNFSVQTA